MIDIGNSRLRKDGEPMTAASCPLAVDPAHVYSHANGGRQPLGRFGAVLRAQASAAE